MKPLRLSLSLSAQVFKRIRDRDLYAEAYEAQKIGKQIFGIEVPFLLKGDIEPESATLTSQIGKLGEHDWRYDVITVFHNRIRSLCAKHKIDFNSVFLFSFCHEVGHAKEQRLFEEVGFYPNTFKVPPQGILIKIESKEYCLRSLPIAGKEFYDIFSCGIQDFAINKELAKHGIRNKIAKKVFFSPDDDSHLLSQSPSICTELQKGNLIIERLSLLPIVIDIYENGELTENEKINLKAAQKEIMGNKWETTLSLLREIEFFNPRRTKEITLELFNKTLEVPAWLGPCYRDSFGKRSTIPRFWNKDCYEVIRL